MSLKDTTKNVKRKTARAQMKDGLNTIIGAGAKTMRKQSQGTKKYLTEDPLTKWNIGRYYSAHPDSPLGKIRTAHPGSPIGMLHAPGRAVQNFGRRLERDAVGTIGDTLESTPPVQAARAAMKGARGIGRTLKSASDWLTEVPSSEGKRKQTRAGNKKLD